MYHQYSIINNYSNSDELPLEVIKFTNNNYSLVLQEPEINNDFIIYSDKTQNINNKTMTDCNLHNTNINGTFNINGIDFDTNVNNLIDDKIDNTNTNTNTYTTAVCKYNLNAVINLNVNSSDDDSDIEF